MRIIVFWGYVLGPQILGNYNFGTCQYSEGAMQALSEEA